VHVVALCYTAIRTNVLLTNPKENAMETLVTLKEAARRLGVSYGTARYFWLKGEVPSQQHGMYILVELDDLRRALETPRSIRRRHVPA
jgi:hypothetical protein